VRVSSREPGELESCSFSPSSPSGRIDHTIAQTRYIHKNITNFTTNLAVPALVTATIVILYAPGSLLQLALVLCVTPHRDIMSPVMRRTLRDRRSSLETISAERAARLLQGRRKFWSQQQRTIAHLPTPSIRLAHETALISL
jgi:hypothetical protein